MNRKLVMTGLLPGPALLSHESPAEARKGLGVSREAFRKPRYSPNDNARWATFLDLDACTRRCPAFRELRTFVDGLVQGA